MAQNQTAQAPNTLDPRVVRTRTALRDALLVLLERLSFDQISIRDITAEANVGYASFFRHYDDKFELLHDLAAKEIAELLNLTLPATQADDTAASCVALCTYVHERRLLWSALLTGGAAAILREEFIRQAKEIPRGKTKSTIPSELLVVHGTGATIEMLSWWLQQGKTVSVKQIAGILDRVVITPTIDALR